MVAKSLDHCLGVGDRHSDTESQQKRQIWNFLPPCIRAERLLGSEVEKNNRHRRKEEDRYIDDVVAKLSEIRLDLLVRLDQEAEADKKKISEV